MKAIELSRLELLHPAPLWSIAQASAWLAATAMLIMLVVAPRAGLAAMWNVLLPVLPAAMAIAPGWWRNLCPLATTSQLARRFRVSAAYQLTPTRQIVFHVTGLALFLVLVPLRHVSLNANALATLTALLIAGGMAAVAGLLFAGKSGWCSGVCPVHPVEKLYGQSPYGTVANAHCERCIRCTAICPDSTKAMSPLTGSNHRWRLVSGWLLVGGFPGFIWGWFHVPDYVSAVPELLDERVHHLVSAYGLPFGAMAASLALYVVLMKTVRRDLQPAVSRTFAAAAIATYYWYRLPALIGYGLFPAEHMLVDLTAVVTRGAVLAAQIGVTAFWAWWFVVRVSPSRSWQIRPPFAAADPPLAISGSRLWEQAAGLVNSVMPTAYRIARR
jgi:hypothetical protein